MAKKDKAQAGTERFKYWQDEIQKALKRFRNFHEEGDATVDAYRQERKDNNAVTNSDKFNILYSSTETIRPNLYAQRPSVYVKRRTADRTSQTALDATMLLEANIKYCIDEHCDFDGVMESVVEDLLLPGLGTAWVRYEPSFKEEPAEKEGGEPVRTKVGEKVTVDYTYWKDFITGICRGWDTVPWIARRWYMDKEEAAKRFGSDKAEKMVYSAQKGPYDNDKSKEDDPTPQAEGWEIWDKRTRKAYWFCASYADDLLDVQDDPLGLKNFWPCPKPLRAISNTRTFIPRGLYSVYKPQAQQLDVLTKRIRLLTEAIRVVGVYDGSQEALAALLNPNGGNKMVKVDSWAMFAQQGGIKGSIEWLPIEQVVQALVQLLQAREICKNEIYEITGFSDIVRGVSKASETLGAQNIKANWAGARVKKTQKDVQRFARDLLAIVGEVISEHFDLATMIEYSGMDVPSPEQIASNPEMQAQAQQVIARFQAAYDLLRAEGRRCAIVDIETDSTIMADEQIERQDRMQFMTAAASFLQQAVPAMTTAPQLGELLGALLMFGVRSYPTARPVEEAFQRLQQQISGQGGMQVNDPNKKEGGDNGEAAAKSAMETAQLKAQSDQATAQLNASIEQQRLHQEYQIHQEKMAFEQQKEQNRHEEAMLKIQLDGAKVELADEKQQNDTALAAEQQAHSQEMDRTSQEHQQEMDYENADRSNTELNHNMNMAEKQAKEKAAKKPD